MGFEEIIMINSINKAVASSTQHHQRSHDVIARISTGRNAKECINAYLNSKQDREVQKLENLLKNLLQKETLAQNDVHKTYYRKALVAIHECAEERGIDISRLIEVLPIEDLDRGIIAPHITQLVTCTEPENYIEAILEFRNKIDDPFISPEKKTALINLIQTQLSIAIQFSIIENNIFFYHHAKNQIAQLNFRKKKNTRKINAIKNLPKCAQTEQNRQRRRGIKLLSIKIDQINNAMQETIEYIRSCIRNFRLWKQWKTAPLSINPNYIPQIPIELPDEPIIHQLEGIN